jgi:Uma2 family endonuclease
MTAIPLREPVYYPEFDGKPMGETGIHGREIREVLQALDLRYRGVPDVLVGGNLIFYPVEGDPRTSFVSDVFVARGVPSGLRRTYKIWEEGKVPQFILEVTSDSTRWYDLGKKRELYARLGIEELFLFDPLDEGPSPPLRGYRLAGGDLEPLEPRLDGSLECWTLGLRLRREDGRLRLIDAGSGEPLLWTEELADRRQALVTENQTLEEKVAQLERELERLRGGGSKP